MVEDKNTNTVHNSKKEAEVSERASIVGMSQTSKKITIVGIIVLTLGALFYIFSSNTTESTKKDEIKEKIQETKKIAQSVIEEDKPITKLPIKLPELPTLVAPVEPPPLPKREVNSQLPKIPVINPQQNDIPRNIPSPPTIQDQITSQTVPKVIEKRRPKITQNRNTPMLVISRSTGAQGSGSNVNLSDPTSIVSGDNLNKIKDSLKPKKDIINEDAPLERTGSEQVKATYIGDLRIIIAQGKLIDAILETSINTDLKGMLRAIVSRDVYSESGKNVLLPKGSRLIGEYDSAISPSQVRVDIIWNRVIRPDGIDLQIQSPGTDQLGKAGITGQVDTKFGHLFMNSFLISSVKIAGAAIVKKLFPSDDEKSSTTTTTDGKTTDNTPASVKIATDAINNLTKTFETVIKQYESSKPTIRIDQGTRVKVFVNKDLVFSHNLK
ncbi:MAG: hypothetical protein HRK26_03735 [Rickettsiaceae bacterium H1]|nr:hypothetical protein [Rickettsiaceae bacterium H1]